MAFLDRAKRVQDQFDGRLRQVGHGRYGRILRMARKPEADEYVRVLEITAIGAVIIGTVGFMLYVFFTEVGPWVWHSLAAAGL
ncbi:MAG: protein translocase SEC61 complex subunit gamma [Thermoplasmata archaeon]